MLSRKGGIQQPRLAPGQPAPCLGLTACPSPAPAPALRHFPVPSSLLKPQPGGWLHLELAPIHQHGTQQGLQDHGLCRDVSWWPSHESKAQGWRGRGMGGRKPPVSRGPPLLCGLRGGSSESPSQGPGPKGSAGFSARETQRTFERSFCTEPEIADSWGNPSLPLPFLFDHHRAASAKPLGNRRIANAPTARRGHGWGALTSRFCISQLERAKTPSARHRPGPRAVGRQSTSPHHAQPHPSLPGWSSVQEVARAATQTSRVLSPPAGTAP